MHVSEGVTKERVLDVLDYGDLVDELAPSCLRDLGSSADVHGTNIDLYGYTIGTISWQADSITTGDSARGIALRVPVILGIAGCRVRITASRATTGTLAIVALDYDQDETSIDTGVVFTSEPVTAPADIPLSMSLGMSVDIAI